MMLWLTDYVIIQEPTSGLDARAAAIVMRLVKSKAPQIFDSQSCMIQFRNPAGVAHHPPVHLQWIAQKSLLVLHDQTIKCSYSRISDLVCLSPSKKEMLVYSGW